MIIRRQPRSYVWLPVPLAVIAVCSLIGVTFVVASIDWSSHATPVKTALLLLGVAAFWTAPLLLEVRVISTLASGAIAVRWPLGRFEAPAEGTRIDVRQSTKQRYVVWITPTREVKLAFAYSVVRAVSLAEQIKEILELPGQVDPVHAGPAGPVHQGVDPAVLAAAAQETKGTRVFLVVAVGLTIAAIVVAVVLQVVLMFR